MAAELAELGDDMDPDDIDGKLADIEARLDGSRGPRPRRARRPGADGEVPAPGHAPGAARPHVDREAGGALRKFLETVDQVLPRLGEAPSWRQQVIDSGLEMAESLVQAQYDFLRNVVHSAGQSLGASTTPEK